MKSAVPRGNAWPGFLRFHDVARRAWHGRVTPSVVSRWLADLGVPLAVFWWQIGVWTLRVHAAPRMMRLDWTTYIIAPNYLRSAPLFTMPLAGIPGYISPPGASLGITDANPLLTPLYRLANALSPDRPVQFVGWQLLAAYVLTYLLATRFVETAVRRLRNVERLSVAERVGARGVALMAIVMPMFTQRWVHVTLAQQWLLVWALHLAVFDRRYDRRGVIARLVVCLLATAIQPYWLPMVGAVTVPYIVGWFRRSPKATAIVTGAAAAGVVVLMYVLGFVDGRFSSSGRDYGNYSADLTTLFNPRGRDRVLSSLPNRFGNTEGLAFPGLGLLLVLIAGCALYGAVVKRRRVPVRVRGVLALCALLAVMATLPIVRWKGATVVDLTHTPFGLVWLGEKFRTNGRFVWPAVWLLVMVTGAVVVAWRRWVGVAAIVVAVTVQLMSTTPERIEATSSTMYHQIYDALRREQAAGATRVEMQPPWVVYGCSPGKGSRFADSAPILLAAAVTGMSVNSGYPGRPPVEAIQRICVDEAANFRAGRFRQDTVYVRPRQLLAVAGLVCRTASRDFVVCRAAEPTDPSQSLPLR